MELGGDFVSWGCVVGALLATAGAALAGRGSRLALAVALLVVAGVLLRGNLSHRFWLSDWDERHHAVAGRNFVDHPLVPTLVDRPFDDVPPEVWNHTDIWLHKPPVALWLIAGSLRVFGENEFAVRIPSLLFAGLGILLTFAIGRRLLGAPVGLLAAAIHTWHGRLAELAAGLRATDHVDHQFAVLVELGVWLALVASDALQRRPRSLTAWGATVSCGVVVGVALLTKSVPALVVVGVLGLALLARPVSWFVRLGAPALTVAIALAIQWPWHRYVSQAFPEAASFYADRNARYFGEAIDGQGGAWWFYGRDMAEVFGVLAPVAVALFLVHAARHSALWSVFGWLVATFGVFSLAATKMTGYVVIAAPAVMLAMAWVWHEAWRGGVRIGPQAIGHRMLASAVVLAFVVQSVVPVHRPWRAPKRRPLWAAELHALGERSSALPGGPWVIFGVPSVPEARFYTRTTLLGRAPTPQDLARARTLGFRVALYGEPDAELPASDVTVLPHDPRTRSHRELLAQLPTPPAGAEVWLWNARDPGNLEDYLERFVPVDARERVPTERDFARATADGGPVAILVRGGDAPDPAVPPGLAYTRVVSEAHAN